MAIKVLMVGGRRCGKTSALASMFDQIKNGPVNKIFTITDDTVIEKKISPITGKEETKEALEVKTLELKSRLDTPNNRIFLIDQAPTYNDWTYTLNLHVPGAPKRSTTIEFTDCPGEFFHPGLFKEHAKTLTQESDVFVIMVDTPYLMSASPTMNEAVNCTGTIPDILDQINKNNEKNAYKMVIFVPIKCEKWMNEGRIDVVINKLKDVFSRTIENLEPYNNFNVAIIPIETAGNIEFIELKDAYTLTRDGKTIRCCELGQSKLRTEDGIILTRKDGDIVNRDIKAIVSDSNTMPRPYAWYHINTKANPLYNPYNCEQLPLHILQFMLSKLIKEYKKPILIPDILWRKIFGGMTKNDLELGLKSITNQGLLKNNQDGIEYLKRSV